MIEGKYGRERGPACLGTYLGRFELCAKLRKIVWQCAKNIVTEVDDKYKSDFPFLRFTILW